MTTPAAPAAGIHLPWHRVPDAVKAWAAGVALDRPSSEEAPSGVSKSALSTSTLSASDRSPLRVSDRSGGFSPGATSVLEWSDRSIFVKAVGVELNPDSPDIHRREIQVSSALPRTPRFPRLLSSYDDHDWVALAFDVVEGRPPAHPWQRVELERVAHALLAMHADLTMVSHTPVEPLSEFARGIFGGWADLAENGPPSGLDPWAVNNLDRLASLEAAWPEACDGSTLVHGDVRSDNVLISTDAVVFVDWPHGAVGNPAFDVVAWAPSVELEGGPTPEELLDLYDPSHRLDADGVTVLLTAIAGFFVSHSFWPPPPGLPTLRPFQAAQGDVALSWLRRRTGW